MTDQPTLIATRYGLLVAESNCYHCQAPAPTTVLWGGYQELEAGEVVGQDSAALSMWNPWMKGLWDCWGHAPWVRPAATKTLGITYWINHCNSCGSVQGDHFVHGVNGPYWPQDEGGCDRLMFVPGDGSITDVAGASRNGWMELVASRYPKLP